MAISDFYQPGNRPPAMAPYQTAGNIISQNFQAPYNETPPRPESVKKLTETGAALENAIDVDVDRRRREAGEADYSGTPLQEAKNEQSGLHREPTQYEIQNVQADTQNVQNNPAGAIAASTAGKVNGVGNTFGLIKPPTPPTMYQVNTQIQDEQAKQVVFDHSKDKKWYETNSFNAGLLAFGLNLLSGNDYATAFNQAAKTFDEHYGYEQRNQWRYDLLKQGYDEAEVQRYIDTGDNKVLTSAMEKKQQQQQYQLNQYHLQQAAYEASPQYRKYKQDHQNWQDQMSIAKFQQGQQNAQLDYQIKQEQLATAKRANDIKYQAALQKADPWFGVDNATRKTISTVVKPYYDKVMNKTSQFSQAENLIEQAKALRAAGGDERKVTSLYHSAQEAYARGMKGTLTGGVSPHEVEEFAGNPNLVAGTWSGIKTGMGGDIPNYELDRLGEAAAGTRQAEMATWNEFAQNQYDQLVREMGPERAQRVMSLYGMTSGHKGGWETATGAGGVASEHNVTITRK